MSQQGLEASRLLTQQYADVVAALRPRNWAAPSRCAGWRVQDLVAHTGSNFKALVDPPQPPAAPVPGLTAERAMDMLVDDRRDWTPEQVRQEFEDYRAPALDVLAAMQSEPLAAQPLTIHELGTYPTADLADAFAFDLYCHLRVDLLAPTGPVEAQVPPATEAVAIPAIGWMLTGLPQMCQRVNAQAAQPVGLVLTGPGGGEWTLRQGPDLLEVVLGADGAAALVRSSAHDFVLWGTGRTRWRDWVTLEGDEALAAQVLDAVDVV